LRRRQGCAAPSTTEGEGTSATGTSAAGAEAGLATVSAGRGGLRLVAVDGAAHAAGIRPDLTLADARALQPALAVRPADAPADAAALDALADWCSRWTPWTAVDPDETHRGPFGAGRGLLLDVSGCAHLFGGEAMLLDDLLARVRRLGFAARAAIAGSAGAAWAVARFGGERRTIVADIARTGSGDGLGGLGAALAPLPVAALRLPQETAVALSRVGLRRVGDLLALPRAPLAARFGDLLLRRLDQALGILDEPLSPRLPPPAFRTRLAFAEPIGRSEDVAATLDHLLVDLCARLQAAGMGARRLEFTLYRTDGTLARAAVGTSRPSRAPDHLRRLFREALDGIDAGFGIEAATLDAPAVDPLSPAQAALELDGKQPRALPLAQLIDRLASRLGSGAVVRLTPLASHIPERAWRAVPVMAGEQEGPAFRTLTPPLSRKRSANIGERIDAENEHRSRQPRPLQLLASPEPIEVIAPVPDGPPALFRRGRTLHRIRRADGPERIGDEWWLAPPGQPSDEAARVRDYWRVEDADGGRFWIFREGIRRADRPPRWWLHGLFA